MHDQNDDLIIDDGNHLALIGFGEAAQAFVKGWHKAAVDPSITAYDIQKSAMNAASAAKLRGAVDMAQLLEGTKRVISLVTADQAMIAAKSAARHIQPGTVYFDGNSCAPDTKQQNARMIEAAGGHYIDMAIMAPVHPKLHKTPIIISGGRADQALDILRGLGMAARIEPGPVGRASSIKMIRSIMVKGMEALMAEAMLAGRRAGVEDFVLASLEKSWPGFDWEAQATYNLERMMVHGQRRAAEMREVVKTIDDLGLASPMAQATVTWQQAIGSMELAAGEDELTTRLDAVLDNLGKGEK